MWTLAVEDGDWDFSSQSSGRAINDFQVLEQLFSEELQTLSGQDAMNPDFGCALELMAGTPSSVSEIQTEIREAIGAAVSRAQSLYKQNPSLLLPSQTPVSYVVINTGSNSWEVLTTTLGGAFTYDFEAV